MAEVKHHGDAREVLARRLDGPNVWADSSTFAWTLLIALAEHDPPLVVRPADEVAEWRRRLGVDAALQDTFERQRNEWAQRAGAAVARSDAAERERDALREVLGGVARHITEGRLISAGSVATAALAAEPAAARWGVKRSDTGEMVESPSADTLLEYMRESGGEWSCYRLAASAPTPPAAGGEDCPDPAHGPDGPEGCSVHDSESGWCR